MMTVRKVSENTKWVGAIDWNRRLFDELIPLPNGTTYNSYFIQGSEKNMLIDTVDPEKKDVLMKNLESLGIDSIDYVVANHGEQDHSGLIKTIIDEFSAEVLLSQQGKSTITSLLDVSEDDVRVISDGEKISLGDLDIEFMIAPWVHWPDTMFTYLKQDGVLFSTDFLGSHYASSELFVNDFGEIKEAAKKYFAEIMMPFSSKIEGYVEKIKEIDPKIIAPSHGPLYDDPDMILDKYSNWASEEMKNKVVVPYVSMHGSTEKMVNYFIDSLIEEGVEVELFHMTESDIGDLAMSIVDAATIVIGAPMVLGGVHPVMFYGSYLINALNPNTKYLSVIGSYGWGGRMIQQLKENTKSLDAELLEPITTKGAPDKTDFEAIDELAKKIADGHESSELIK